MQTSGTPGSSWASKLHRWGAGALTLGRKGLDFYKENESTISHIADSAVKLVSGVIGKFKSDIPLPDPVSEEDIAKNSLFKNILSNQKFLMNEISEEHEATLKEAAELAIVGKNEQALEKRSRALESSVARANAAIDKRLALLDKEVAEMDDEEGEMYDSLKFIARKLTENFREDSERAHAADTEVFIDTSTDMIRDVLNLIPSVGSLYAEILDSAHHFSHGVRTLSSIGLQNKNVDAVHDSGLEIIAKTISKRHEARREALRANLEPEGSKGDVRALLESMSEEIVHVSQFGKNLSSHVHSDDVRSASVGVTNVIGLHCYVLSQTNGEIFFLEAHSVAGDVTVGFFDLFDGVGSCSYHTLSTYIRPSNILDLVWRNKRADILSHHPALRPFIDKRSPVHCGNIMVSGNYDRLSANICRVSRDLSASFVGTYAEIRRDILRRIVGEVYLQR